MAFWFDLERGFYRALGWEKNVHRDVFFKLFSPPAANIYYILIGIRLFNMGGKYNERVQVQR